VAWDSGPSEWSRLVHRSDRVLTSLTFVLTFTCLIAPFVLLLLQHFGIIGVSFRSLLRQPSRQQQWGKCSRSANERDINGNLRA
jgi:hypothetical protein